MMEEIITLIIHEAETREGAAPDLKLREVMTEINLKVGTMINDLARIKEMQTTDETKQAMRNIVLTSHKT